MTEPDKGTRGRRPPRRKPSKKPSAEPAPEQSPLPLEELGGGALLVQTPEVGFAERVPAPPPPPPRPSTRRAIFIDVENTSRASDVERMLEHLAVDRAGVCTDLVASGNWRVIGTETARLLARHGAHLVHSAPATGVRDWSDLRIAVAAGMWLASARPGDSLDIVSADRAFDVVGDVAASLGVHFQRLAFRGSSAAGARGPKRTRESRKETGAARTPAPPPEPGPAAATAAPEEELLAIVRRLLASSQGAISLDAVANHLKALGFERPPGSPRLVTRLRQMPELDVSPRGLIRLRAAAEAPAPEQVPAPAAPSRRRRGRRRPSSAQTAST